MTLEKWNLDAQKVDGYSASTGTTANTIPVRNANGKLPGDITGNASTASSAAALSATNPIDKGGTGATTAAQARANLVVPPKSHASSSTEYGAGSSTQYGHLKSHDEPDATLTAATGHAFSPAGAASMKTELEEQIEEVETGASSQLSSLDSSLRALIAQEAAKCLKLTGGTMTGMITVSGINEFIKRDVNNGRLVFLGGPDWPRCASLELWGGDAGGQTRINAQDGTNGASFVLYPTGAAQISGRDVITSAGGTLTGSLLVPNILSSANDGFGLYGGNAWRTGGYIELGGPNHTHPNHIQIVGGSRQVLEDLGEGWKIEGSDILRNYSMWHSGDNGYFLMTNSILLQWGFSSFNGRDHVRQNLHFPYSHRFYNIQITGYRRSFDNPWHPASFGITGMETSYFTVQQQYGDEYWDNYMWMTVGTL